MTRDKQIEKIFWLYKIVLCSVMVSNKVMAFAWIVTTDSDIKLNVKSKKININALYVELRFYIGR